MKKIRLAIACTAIFAGVAAAGAIAFTSGVDGNRLLATPDPSYTCGSLKFGMLDSDCTAVTWQLTTAISAGVVSSDYFTTSSSEVDSVTVSSYVYGDSSYTYSGADHAKYSKYAIRLGKGSNKGTLTIGFKNANLIGATIYALQYNTDPVTVTVNGQETTLSNSINPDSKEANADKYTFDPYSFSFDATDTLTITAKQNTVTVAGKSVSACRFYLANIAFKFSAAA